MYQPFRHALRVESMAARGQGGHPAVCAEAVRADVAFRSLFVARLLLLLLLLVVVVSREDVHIILRDLVVVSVEGAESVAPAVARQHVELVRKEAWNAARRAAKHGGRPRNSSASKTLAVGGGGGGGGGGVGV